VRVLGPGGRLAIVDIHVVADEYVVLLGQLGMRAIGRRGLGPRFWYSGPWGAADLVTARKPDRVRRHGPA